MPKLLDVIIEKCINVHITEESASYKKISAYDAWRFPTQEELQKSGTNINYEKAKSAKVVDLPKYLYKKGGGFEPFTHDDLAKPLAPHAKRILGGYAKGHSIPYVTVMRQDGKLTILDGYTRTGVAAPLGIRVKALELTPDMFDKRK